MQNTVHIIGAGISGLSAAVRLVNAGFEVRLHEATQQAGGRCRSYFDAATNLTIDNGNHLLLSGNRHALAYARSIGTEAGLVGPKRAQFPFVDLTSGQRWQLDLGESRLPLWVLDSTRRVPDTGLLDYLALMPLIWAANSKRVGDAIPCRGTLYQRLVQPLLLAALNVDPPEGSAGLAGAVVRETLAKGGRACRPLVAREGLGAVFVDPALPKVCAPLVERARGHFETADEVMARNPRRLVRAPRIMSKYYRAILELLVARGFAAPRAPVRLNKVARIAIVLRYAFI